MNGNVDRLGQNQKTITVASDPTVPGALGEYPIPNPVDINLAKNIMVYAFLGAKI